MCILLLLAKTKGKEGEWIMLGVLWMLPRSFFLLDLRASPVVQLCLDPRDRLILVILPVVAGSRTCGIAIFHPPLLRAGERCVWGGLHHVTDTDLMPLRRGSWFAIPVSSLITYFASDQGLTQDWGSPKLKLGILIGTDSTCYGGEDRHTEGW